MNDEPYVPFYKPYVPFYKPYGMSDEEYQYQLKWAEELHAEWVWKQLHYQNNLESTEIREKPN